MTITVAQISLSLLRSLTTCQYIWHAFDVFAVCESNIRELDAFSTIANVDHSDTHFCNCEFTILTSRKSLRTQQCRSAIDARSRKKTKAISSSFDTFKHDVALKLARIAYSNTKRRIVHSISDFRFQRVRNYSILSNSMRAQFEIVRMMSQIIVTSVELADERKRTRISIRNDENHLIANLFSSRRSFNKRRRLLFSVATNDRARFNESDIDDESLDNRSNVVDDSSLFLSQNEKENENENSQFEQHHDDYDVEFDFDIESDSNDVVFIIERTESTKAFFSERDRLWISISRRSIVVERSLFSLFECFRLEWMRKIYATSSRTVTRERTKKKKKNEKKKNEMKR